MHMERRREASHTIHSSTYQQTIVTSICSLFSLTRNTSFPPTYLRPLLRSHPLHTVTLAILIFLSLHNIHPFRLLFAPASAWPLIIFLSRALSRLNEIREREQKRIRNAESTAVASSFSPSAPVLSASNHDAADATPGNARGMPQQNLHQQHQQHQQPQQDQFMFGTDSSGLPGAADQVSGLNPSWDGMLAPFGPPSDSPDGRAGSAASNTFDDLVFSLRQSQYNNHSLANVPGHPPIPQHASPASSSNVLAVATSGWPAVINDENLIRWLDIYFDRLYPTLPILKRSSVFARLLAQEHRTNPDFGAMLLSLSAFGLIQPVRVSEQRSASSSSRQQMVDLLLMESVRMRTVVDFGQSPTMDMIFTSVFLFACLFQKGQHNAAWLRMREAVELGCIFGLDKFDCYLNCSPEQKQQRLRVYYLLSVTER
jgi:hypothetical protein